MRFLQPQSEPRREYPYRERTSLEKFASGNLIRVIAVLGIGVGSYNVTKHRTDVEVETFFTKWKTESAQEKGLARDKIEAQAGIQRAEDNELKRMIGTLQPTLEERGPQHVEEMQAEVRKIFGDHIGIGISAGAVHRTLAIAHALEKVGVPLETTRFLDADKLAEEKRPTENPEIRFETHGKFKKAFAPEDIEHATKDLPNGWFRGEVSKVTFSEKIMPAPQEYGFSKESETMARFTSGIAEIQIDRGFFLVSKKERIRTLYHEIAHANDWRSDNHMSREQRLSLVLKIHARLQAKDRFKSAYVEGIHNKDPQEQIALRATEYWAEICAAYFLNPDTLDVKDYAIVDEVVSVADPTYDPHKIARWKF